MIFPEGYTPLTNHVRSVFTPTAALGRYLTYGPLLPILQHLNSRVFSCSLNKRDIFRVWPHFCTSYWLHYLCPKALSRAETSSLPFILLVLSLSSLQHVHAPLVGMP